MKTIIVGYLSGIVYVLLCTDIIKLFAGGSNEIFDYVIERVYIKASKIKLLKLVADLIMFVFMLITVMLWPIGLLYDLFIIIKKKYWEIRFIRKLKKIKKMLDKALIGKTN